MPTGAVPTERQPVSTGGADRPSPVWAGLDDAAEICAVGEPRATGETPLEPFQWTIIGPPDAELRPAAHASSVETASTLARLCGPDGSGGTASADQVAPSHSHERARHVVAVIPTPTIQAFVVDEASTENSTEVLENSGVVASVQPHGAPAFAAGAQAREPATTRSPIRARRMSLMSER